jgi:hypothetical protein
MFRQISVVVLLSVALLPAVGNAQVSPAQVAEIAKTVHDAERWNLGASSTRETRNEFWARVIGIVHWGHPVYNPTPDPSWCLKDGGGGRPQTDDVATKCATREYWDCIGGVGANGYENQFRCNGHSDRLPAVQNVYPPPKPAGGGVSSGGGGTPLPAPPAPAPAPVNLAPILAKLDAQAAQIAALVAKLDAMQGAVNAAAAESLNAASRASEIKTLIENLPASKPLPCLTGRVPRAWGGSADVTFCPKE